MDYDRAKEYLKKKNYSDCLLTVCYPTGVLGKIKEVYLSELINDYTQHLQDIIDFQLESIKKADELCKEKEQEIDYWRKIVYKDLDKAQSELQTLREECTKNADSVGKLSAINTKLREENERLQMCLDVNYVNNLESELKEARELIEKVKKCAELHERDKHIGNGHLEELLELLNQ